MQLAPKFTNYTPERTLEGVQDIAKRARMSKFSCIVAPVRGGLIPGVMLSHALGIPLFPLSYSLRDHKAIEDVPSSLLSFVENKRNLPVLLVDDIVDNGSTINGILEHLKMIPIIDVAALAHNIEAPVKVRYSHQEFRRSVCSDWFNFFWEIT